MRPLFSCIWGGIKAVANRAWDLAVKAWDLAVKAWDVVAAGAAAALKWFLGLSFGQQAAIVGGVALVGVGIYYRKKLWALAMDPEARKKLREPLLEAGEFLAGPFSQELAVVIKGINVAFKLHQAGQACPA